jgi:hypothetical protein
VNFVLLTLIHRMHTREPVCATQVGVRIAEYVLRKLPIVARVWIVLMSMIR